jgi:hypothetical protein
MKRLNQLILLIIVLCLSANAGWIDLGGGIEGKSPDITLISDDASGCQFSVTLYGFYLDTVDIPEGSFSVISLPSATYKMEKGNPELPKLDMSVIIPDNGGVSCEIQNEAFEIFDVLPVIPSKGSLLRTDDPDTIPYTFNDLYYNGEWFPSSYQDLYEPFIIRDYRGVNVCLNVFRHNPTQNLLEVATKFDVVLTYDDPQFIIRDSISGSFLGIYKHLFLNFSESRYNDPRDIRMEIIYDFQFLSQANQLANWKMKKGLSVTLKSIPYEIARTAEAIKNEISWQVMNNYVDFFILIGDSAEIPSFRQSDPEYPNIDYLADPIYVLVQGNDDYPDAYISRISGNTIERIDPQIQKILDYEKLPPSLPTYPFTWAWGGLVIASSQYNDKDHKHNFAGPTMLLRSYEFVNERYDAEANPPNITSILNDGRGFVNYMGHGMWDRWIVNIPSPHTVFDRDNVFDLWNIWELPFVLSVACDVGDFGAGSDHNGCFAECWLQRFPQRGAIGFYGSSSPQPIVEPVWADSVAILSFTNNWFIGEDFPNNIGEIVYVGGISMIRNYHYWPPYKGPYTFNTWHIFGDASIQLRFGMQCSLKVSHPKVVPPSKPFDVYVKYTPYYSGLAPQPCHRAVVCLWKEDENYHIYKQTDQNGHVQFDAAPRRMGSMYITVTRYNASAYEGSVTICDTNVGPNRGDQSNNVEIVDGYMNLFISPSISGKTFRIGIPYYATSVDIYNKIGNLVRKAMIDKNEFIWNGMDERGKFLPQGVYFIKASGDGKTEVRKVLLIK